MSCQHDNITQLIGHWVLRNYHLTHAHEIEGRLIIMHKGNTVKLTIRMTHLKNQGTELKLQWRCEPCFGSGNVPKLVSHFIFIYQSQMNPTPQCLAVPKHACYLTVSHN